MNHTNRQGHFFRPMALAILLLALLVTGCSKPLPEDKKDYAGLWQSDDKNFTLRIYTSGEVEFERKSGNNTVSLNGPIKEFNGDDFVVGIWFMTAEFKVSEPPQLKDGEWQMVVDEVRVTRQ